MKTQLTKLGLALSLALAFTTVQTAHALDVGDAAPCVILDGVDAAGKNTHGCIRDTIQADHTHTIVDFFSVHCSTCRANLPKVAALTRNLADKATVRYVSVDRSIDEVKQFLAEAPFKGQVNNPVAFDVDRDAKKAYGVSGTPTMFILDANYTVVYKHEGKLTADDLAQIQALVRGN